MTTRPLRLSLVALGLAAVFIGCGGEKKASAPTDPTGHFEIYASDDWMTTVARGAPPPTSVAMKWHATLDFFPDRTYHYEWRSLDSQNVKGSADGTWRAPASAWQGSHTWMLTPRGQPETPENDYHTLANPIAWAVLWGEGAGWMAPRVDFEHGRIDGAALWNLGNQSN